MLHPQRFELMGVPDEAFLERRSRADLKEIIECSGCPMQNFDEVFDAVAQLINDDQGTVSLDAYLYVTQQLINADVKQQVGGL